MAIALDASIDGTSWMHAAGLPPPPWVIPTTPFVVPADTRSGVARSLRALERFPLLGPALEGRWDGFRFLLGPWRWLVIVYVFIEPEDRVVVVAVQDARSSASATGLG
jgi:hypothetical protein